MIEAYNLAHYYSMEQRVFWAIGLVEMLWFHRVLLNNQAQKLHGAVNIIIMKFPKCGKITLIHYDRKANKYK